MPIIDIQTHLLANLQKRKDENLFRTLTQSATGIDFSSNDYLGLAKNEILKKKIAKHTVASLGSTGSRLLTGNSALYEETEKAIAGFHGAEDALIFNSGYDANIGLFSTIPQKGDIIFYDEFVHASIRDGIRLSNAESFSFKHNDVEHFKKKAANTMKSRGQTKQVYVVLESIYSMDGDIAPIREFADYCTENTYNLIIDEAHSNGIYGDRGEGMVSSLGLEDACFARIYTFGKAIGIHGAAIVGSSALRDYLINFCRSFIYTTALPEHTIYSIKSAYEMLPELNAERAKLKKLSDIMNPAVFSPIHTILFPGNDNVRKVAGTLQKQGFDVRPILSPTVPKGAERIRICLHAYNSEEEVANLYFELKNIS